ncbi:MAG: type II toxin-antitoxin system Phd/YefM family antitoxin [Chloroflexia bacterium]|nr:type II toxin-antitoxin system Phd/YefM family antitoxin [Chloroflexia bacterium]
MSKTVTAHEAQNQFSILLDDVSDGGEEVIVERHGSPRAVLISYDVYQQVQELREKQHRAEAVEELRALQEEISARNQDLTEEESIALAIEVSDEIIKDIMARDRANAKHEAGRPG